MKRAFTLIELLVVISIIALLSSIVLASLNTAREKGRLAGIRGFAASVDHIAGDYAVGIWDLNECSGTVVADRSGYANVGTANGILGWSATDTPSGTGCSYAMNGTTQSISAGAVGAPSYNFGATTDFTLAAWVKGVSFSNGPFIIDLRHTHGGTNGGYTMLIDSSTGRPCLRLGDGTNVNSFCPTSGSYMDGKWHHYVISVDRAATLATFYGDGQGIGTASIAGIGNIDRLDTNLSFGTKDGTAANAINGSLDDIRIFAKKLSASNVQALYASEASEHNLANR